MERCDKRLAKAAITACQRPSLRSLVDTFSPEVLRDSNPSRLEITLCSAMAPREPFKKGRRVNLRGERDAAWRCGLAPTGVLLPPGCVDDTSAGDKGTDALLREPAKAPWTNFVPAPPHRPLRGGMSAIPIERCMFIPLPRAFGLGRGHARGARGRIHQKLPAERKKGPDQWLYTLIGS